MALSPRKERGRPVADKKKSTEELKLTNLVVRVRDHHDEHAFVELQSHVEFYVKLFGNKYRIPGCDSDEIEQECWIALRTKAIEDFNPQRGKFKSFAILCIRRHLFSIIKGNNQHKRRVLNESLSLDEDRSDEGENLSLASLIVREEPAADEAVANDEDFLLKQAKLVQRLSRLEKEVFKLYLQQMHYDEIVTEIRRIMPSRPINKKTIDNGLQRIRSKALDLAKTLDFDD
jgi:RNA polymerase sporulation-specific sigma factor